MGREVAAAAAVAVAAGKKDVRLLVTSLCAIVGRWLCSLGLLVSASNRRLVVLKS